jgi:hypothetical protein
MAGRALVHFRHRFENARGTIERTVRSTGRNGEATAGEKGSESGPAFETFGLSKTFGATVAVDGVNLVVPRGSFYGLVGPNGAGRSTTLAMAVGLLRPDRGGARTFGVDVWRNPARAKALVGELLDSAVLRWAGLPVGIATGAALTWWCGRIAVRTHKTDGPELHLLRHGRTAPDRSAKSRAGPTGDGPPSLTGKLVIACWSLCWLPLVPQGIVPLIFKLTEVEARSWFLALYLPAPFQWPTIFAMIGLGLLML